MERLRFFEHDGVRILLVDYSGISTAGELRDALRKAGETIRQHPERSLLILVDLRQLPYTLENVALLRDAAVENSPHVRARAVVGVPEIARFSIRGIGRLTGRKLESFDSVEEAAAWLVEEA